VILDEAHVVKNPKVQQSQACLALTSSRRWAVTGTPIMQDVADLYGIFVFLKLSPLDKSAYFDAYVKRVFTATGNHYGGTPLPLLYCLSRCMIRHTKAQQLGGAPVLSLPPKTEEKIEVIFNAEERAADDKVHKAAKAQFGRALRRPMRMLLAHAADMHSAALSCRGVQGAGSVVRQPEDACDHGAVAAPAAHGVRRQPDCQGCGIRA
jgi:SNF2 family DNA or RNA helicase